MGFISVDLLYVLGVHLICNCIVSLYLFEVYMTHIAKQHSLCLYVQLQMLILAAVV